MVPNLLYFIVHSKLGKYSATKDEHFFKRVVRPPAIDYGCVRLHLKAASN